MVTISNLVNVPRVIFVINEAILIVKGELMSKLSVIFFLYYIKDIMLTKRRVKYFRGRINFGEDKALFSSQNTVSRDVTSVQLNCRFYILSYRSSLSLSLRSAQLSEITRHSTNTSQLEF